MQEAIKIKLLPNYDVSFGLPGFAKKGDAGLDLRNFSESKRRIHLIPGDMISIPTGVAMAIPEGWCGVMLERSGHGKYYGTSLHGRVIDSGYRGELFIILTVAKECRIEYGERIAQVVFTKVLTTCTLVDELDDTERGADGFGSTGKH